MRYDALLLASFGGPEGPDDVVPFLENVTRGRGIPRERLVEVGAHYALFGGVSPINGQNRALLAALRQDLPAHGIDLPVYWGNRNWGPYFAEALAQMRDDGVRRALVVVTSAYSSWSGCRQYRENLAAARAEVGEGAPELDKVRAYFDHPGFVGPFIRSTLAALAGLPEPARDAARLVFTTHSVPLAMAESSGPPDTRPPQGAYVAQHEAVAALVAEGLAAAEGRARPYDLVFQSRSGSPQVPWLEPDIVDHLEALAAGGAGGVVVVPIGFVSDHLEVVYDLDTQAREAADRLGLPFARAATPGTDPEFVAMLRELVLERLADVPARALSPLGPWPDACAVGCCANPRGAVPVIAGAGE